MQELSSPAEPTVDDAAPTWFRRLLFYSISSALCAAVPVPLLDDQLLRAVRRRMVGELANARGIRLAEPHLLHLSGTEPSTGLGCVLGVAMGLTFKIAFKLIRRVFRTIFFWLLLRDMTNEASKTFHEGYLLQRGMPVLGRLPTADPNGTPATPAADGAPVHSDRTFDDAVIQLRSRVVAVCRQVDTRLFRRLVKESIGGSTRLLRIASRRVLRILRRKKTLSDAEREAVVEAEVPETMVERLQRAISANNDYLVLLDRHWDDLG